MPNFLFMYLPITLFSIEILYFFLNKNSITLFLFKLTSVLYFFNLAVNIKGISVAIFRLRGSLKIKYLCT
jgi:hypothetical protein